MWGKFKIFTLPHKIPSEVLKNKKLVIGFDPKLFSKRSLSIFIGDKKNKFLPLEGNLIDKIWNRKIIEPHNKFYSLPDRSVGGNYKYKIKKIMSYLKNKKADYQFITASENNAWLLNIRGRDTKYTPIPNSYILMDKNKKIYFFCNLKKLTKSFKKI